MSNPENQFKQGFTFEEFLDKWSDYLQGKVDKRGGVVASKGSNQRLAASWVDLVDDLILCVAENGLGGSSEIVDNFSAPFVIDIMASGESVNGFFEIPTVRNRLEILWSSITRIAEDFSQRNMRVELYTNDTFEIGRRIVLIEYTASGAATEWHDQSSGNGHGIATDAFFNELQEPSPGMRRIFIRVTNLTQSPTRNAQFILVGRAFDHAQTPIVEQVKTPE